LLFTDLVGSSALMTEVGEPAFDELRRPHFAALRAAIERTGGQEIKNTGDGVMAVFGPAAEAVGVAAAQSGQILATSVVQVVPGRRTTASFGD
jgi:class 3 adenylate cyclase